MLTQTAHRLISDHFADQPKRLAIDATCGNGHDCEFLARLGFDKVIAFDVQAQALTTTRERLDSDLLLRVQLILDGHQNLGQHVRDKIDCAMFNLGYLPRSNKALTTQAETTLSALNAATRCLAANGLISILCYPGHQTGALETAAVQTYLSDIEANWETTTVLSNTPKPSAPILYLLTRKH